MWTLLEVKNVCNVRRRCWFEKLDIGVGVFCFIFLDRLVKFNKIGLALPGRGCAERKQPRSHKFLCLRVGKPMKKTFVSNASASMQQYAQQGKKHEYWFAVPQERWALPRSQYRSQRANVLNRVVCWLQTVLILRGTAAAALPLETDQIGVLCQAWFPLQLSFFSPPSLTAKLFPVRTWLLHRTLAAVISC